jgi:hypothetical protein
MKKLHLAIVLSMVALLALGSIAIARRGVVDPEGTFNIISIMKTYDTYKVQCTRAECREEGKCLGTIDACTTLTLCGLQFDNDVEDKYNSEYWVYEWPEDIDDPQDALDYIRDNDIPAIGWSVDSGEYQKASLSKYTEYGRVRYHLLVYVKNNTRTPSQLMDATLCLGAQGQYNDGMYVGGDYEQVNDVYAPADLPTTKVVMPVKDNEDIGQNVILCPIECQ